MNIKSTLSILFVAFSITITAQSEKMLERIEAKKIAFITQKIDLSIEESQTFWPVYNEHQTAMKSLKNKYRLTEEVSIENMTDAQAAQFVENRMNFANEEVKLKNAYIKQLKSALPIRKIAILMSIESQFKKQLLKAVGRRGKMRDKRMEKLEKRKGK